MRMTTVVHKVTAHVAHSARTHTHVMLFNFNTCTVLLHEQVPYLARGVRQPYRMFYHTHTQSH
jgi:hypothetical protein